MKLHVFVTALVLGTACVESAEVEANKLKVLVHSNVGRSHIKPLFEICKIMRANGHDIKYAANDDNLKYAQEYGYDFISLGKSSGLDQKSTARFGEIINKREKVDMLRMMGSLMGMMNFLYENTYLPLFKFAESYQPDLIMCDFFAPACRDVAEKLKIPFIIGFQTTDAFNIVPSQTTTGSMEFQPITTDELTFWQRLSDKFLQPILGIYHMSPLIKNLNSLRKKYGVPTSYMPFGRFDNVYAIANTFTGFEPANGIPPNIHLAGPILSDEYAMLNDDLKAFFDNTQRILYIAFGSNVPLTDFDIDYLLNGAIIALENNVIDGVVWGLGKTLTSNFPETISLFNKTIEVADLIEGQHDKIRILKWAPQVDILKHKNTKVFISHGGLESTFEAITSGTPIVSVPVIGDQPRNAKKIENMGIGKYVDRITATPRDTYEAIKYVTEDPKSIIKSNVEKYKLISLQNSKRKYKVAQDLEDLVALARLCRKTEPFQIGKVPCEVQHMIPVSTEMSFIKANNLDLYLFLLVSLVTITTTLIYASYVAIQYWLKYYLALNTTKTKKVQ